MKTILSYSFNEYLEMVKDFHGNPAPGVLIGGFMVDLAYRSFPGDGLYDVICETAKCLPDAVQLLTPCSIGNKWLKIIDVGRYALAFYEKRTGKGVRVYLDAGRLDAWPAIRDWYLKLKPKLEQDSGLLLAEIRNAGATVCGLHGIRVSSEYLKKRKSGPIAVCPSCGEAYPSAAGAICFGCRSGHLPYFSGVFGYLDEVSDRLM